MKTFEPRREALRVCKVFRRDGNKAPSLATLILIGAVILAISCGGGGGGSGGSPSASIQLSPAAAQVAPSGIAQFTATASNSSGSVFLWEVNSIPGGNPQIGTIASSGTGVASYQAPASVPSPATVTIAVVMQANSSISGSATVTVAVPITVTPAVASITTSQTAQFAASGPSISGSSVSWGVDGITGGSALGGIGVISTNGVYAPPATAGLHTITATNNVNTSERASAIIAVTGFKGSYSWRNDAGITGQNQQELALTASTVQAGRFGKVFSCSVDGKVYGQPLYVANLNIGPAGATGAVHHNVVFVATEHDSVYAFDADASPCQTVWQASFLDPINGVSTVPSCFLVSGQCADGGTRNMTGSNDITPEIGITGTPVIDPATGTLYVVAKTAETTAANPTYVQRLHALNILTGIQIAGSPVVISASVPGTGDGNDNQGHVPFNPLTENQQAALQLSGGTLYIAFTSHGDTSPYHGWLLAYSAATLKQTAAFNSTPNNYGGGIGQTGAAPAADGSGTIFTVTGTGTFDATGAPPNVDYAETLLRQQANISTSTLNLLDSFTPASQIVLTTRATPFGSTGALLLPNQTGAPNPLMAVAGSAQGILYLLNRANLGGYQKGANGTDNVLQTLTLGGGVYGTPAYWTGANSIYVAASGDALKMFPLSSSTGLFAAVPSLRSNEIFPFPGGSIAVSSSGATNGLVWILDTSGYGANNAASMPAILRAYNASTLGKAYDTSQSASDAAGAAVPFAVPLIANGKVYVGTQAELSVYGLLP